MGNSLGGKKTAKVMKIDGETTKYKTPVNAGEVLKNFPAGMVLLESESVKHYGIRAKALEPQQELKPKRLYFLVELPKFPANLKGPRRVRSGIQMSAKDRLESLMLARRSVSDLSIMKPASIVTEETAAENTVAGAGGAVRMKVRLPRAEVEKLMMQSKDEADVAEKIMRLCMAKNGGGGGGAAVGGGDTFQSRSGPLTEEQRHWKNDEGIIKRGFKSREKRVGFLPITEGEIQVAVA